MPAEVFKVSKSAVNFQKNKNKNIPSAKIEARQTGTLKNNSADKQRHKIWMIVLSP